MPEHTDLKVPHAGLPPYLEGLEPPATVEDALAYAEERGAPPEVLEFIESLPAAVFTSEGGMRHAFSGLRPGQIPELDPNQVQVGKDGTSN